MIALPSWLWQLAGVVTGFVGVATLAYFIWKGYWARRSAIAQERAALAEEQQTGLLVECADHLKALREELQ